MYPKTEEKAERILLLYNEGNNVQEIIEKVGVATSKKTVKKILASYGIDYTEERLKKKASKPAEVVRMYQEGVSIRKIGEVLRLTGTTVDKILDETIGRRSLSEAGRKRHGYQLNENAFDELTPEVMYWIGMLYADGHVAKGIGYSVELSQHKNDRDVLEKYLQFLKCNKAISESEDNNVIRVRFGCEKIHKRLRELGFKNDKSYTAEPHDLLKHSRDFWRGVVDGDGHVNKSWKNGDGWRQVVHLCGTEATCQGFKEFVDNNGVDSEASVRKVPNESTWVIVYEYRKAKQVADLLYKDATVYLDRKYQKYLEIIEY